MKTLQPYLSIFAEASIKRISPHSFNSQLILLIKGVTIAMAKFPFSSSFIAAVSDMHSVLYSCIASFRDEIICSPCDGVLPSSNNFKNLAFISSDGILCFMTSALKIWWLWVCFNRTLAYVLKLLDEELSSFLDYK
ncbi:uncharacterized protein LOC107883940 [Acyrthosiphon pisum]|uniref:Uncharacterized protein n=1 Tax=Acyrthosiphon pisum TaxID=7029 RepID=A0A8R2NTI0_ACYPI|nr:uncharacterized protein LOC107883940 [Acyrthosiphon pisum]XP_016660481.1 uncharacterized protein LOC107883940 [Acyrthosiphon pisum]XP_029345504.1 uncharacterized protein LOC107883940 [Acyrthosiphon pisum]XP_029345505.1 uncharacterized protein LOC107883940 [Acyrthosiphon pisum]|eukprot:XP_016660480.1 PREDICTED: uncharacterized protein LOC107883940 [Acyrthosiphon pisum]